MSFLHIAITPPILRPGEAERIESMLSIEGVDFVHLRHPELGENEIAGLLRTISTGLLPRITLHDHFRLAETFPIGGIHLNARNPDVPIQFDVTKIRKRIRISRSCHTLDEIEMVNGLGYDYVTLSPIYDSISKPGYKAAFEHDKLKEFLKRVNLPVIALGGVTPRDETELRVLGFSGAAMLGHYWNISAESKKD